MKFNNSPLIWGPMEPLKDPLNPLWEQRRNTNFKKTLFFHLIFSPSTNSLRGISEGPGTQQHRINLAEWKSLRWTQTAGATSSRNNVTLFVKLRSRQIHLSTVWCRTTTFSRRVIVLLSVGWKWVRQVAVRDRQLASLRRHSVSPFQCPPETARRSWTSRWSSRRTRDWPQVRVI